MVSGGVDLTVGITTDSGGNPLIPLLARDLAPRPFPGWVIKKVWPAMVMFPVLEIAVGFAAAENWTVVPPEPDDAEEMVSHGESLMAFHANVLLCQQVIGSLIERQGLHGVDLKIIDCGLYQRPGIQ